MGTPIREGLLCGQRAQYPSKSHTPVPIINPTLRCSIDEDIRPSSAASSVLVNDYDDLGGVNEVDDEVALPPTTEEGGLRRISVRKTPPSPPVKKR